MSEERRENPEPDMQAFVGMARLAYFTPLHEHPTLADRKATFILGANGLLITVLLFFIGPITTLVTRRESFLAIPFLVGLSTLAVLLMAHGRWGYLGYLTL